MGKNYLFFKGIRMKNFLILCFILSSILTLYAFFFGYHPVITKQDMALSYTKRFALYILRFVHYFIFIITKIYPFILDATIVDDMIYSCIGIFSIFHWIYYKDCIFTIIERKLLDPSFDEKTYTPSIFTYEPYIMILLGRQMDLYPVVKLNTFFIMYVCLRMIYNIRKSKKSFMQIITRPRF